MGLHSDDSGPGFGGSLGFPLRLLRGNARGGEAAASLSAGPIAFQRPLRVMDSLSQAPGALTEAVSEVAGPAV